MKKVLLGLLFILPLVFVGCSDDDDNGDYPLNGTVWVETGDDYVETVKFGKGNVTIEFQEDGEKLQSVKGTYTYDGSELVLKIAGETLEGEIRSNTLYLYDDTGDEYGRYTKK